MTTYTGTQEVQPGLYLNTGSFRVTSIDRRPGALPGTITDRYRRVPMLAMLALAPLLGLVFVIFLPLIGFAVMLRLLGERLMQVAAPAVAAIAGVRLAPTDGATTRRARGATNRTDRK